MKRLIVAALESTCGLVDGVPWEIRRWTPLRWTGCGSVLSMAMWSARLDERWGTGVWEPHVHDDECDCYIPGQDD